MVGVGWAYDANILSSDAVEVCGKICAPNGKKGWTGLIRVSDRP